MLARNIAIAWVAAVVVATLFACFRVIIPELINLHNDGALIAAFILIFANLTLPFVVWAKVIKPLLNQEP